MRRTPFAMLVPPPRIRSRAVPRMHTHAQPSSCGASELSIDMLHAHRRARRQEHQHQGQQHIVEVVEHQDEELVNDGAWLLAALHGVFQYHFKPILSRPSCETRADSRLASHTCAAQSFGVRMMSAHAANETRDASARYANTAPPCTGSRNEPARRCFFASERTTRPPQHGTRHTWATG